MEWMESTWSPCGVHVESIWNPSSFHVESMWTFHHSMWNLAIPSSFHVESRWNGDPKMSGITAKTYSMESTWSLHGVYMTPCRLHVECGGGVKTSLNCVVKRISQPHLYSCLTITGQFHVLYFWVFFCHPHCYF